MSLILHLFLLWPAAAPDRPGETAASLSVVLRPGKTPSPATAASPPAVPVAARSDRAEPLLAKDDPPAVPLPAAPPTPSDRTQSNTLASTTEIAQRSDGQPIGMVAAARETSPQPAAATAGPALDADGVRQYRMALAVEARRFKRYPRSALAEEIGGTVEVRVAVAAGGLAQEVALARSSGYGALDDAALEMIRRAAPRTAVPELLRRRSFVVSLPVVFDVASE